jgi:Flp pilus assembly protein TadG
MMRRPHTFLARLQSDRSGLALLEFAFMLPILLTMCLTGAELTNYITTRMRVSQIALQLADDAARMGSGSQLSAKTISETDINDLLTGAQMQSGELDLKTNGRVILSDVEPMANPNTTGKYKIGWQRCYGNKTAPTAPASPAYYPRTLATNIAGVGRANNLVGAQDDNATMFVEVYYAYKPLVGLGTLAPTTTMSEIASMAVRDRRDLTQIYNTEHATAASC